MNLRHLTFTLEISPFNWLRFQVGGPWTGASAIWLIVGPIDIGAHW